MTKSSKGKSAEPGLESFQQEERGPGGWPTDPQVAFIEARYKLDQARRDAARWRSDHAALARRLQHLEGTDRAVRPSPAQPADSPDPRNWRLNISDKHLELYAGLSRKPRELTAREAKLLLELVDAWRDLEHRKHMALMQTAADDERPTSPE